MTKFKLSTPQFTVLLFCIVHQYKLFSVCDDKMIFMPSQRGKGKFAYEQDKTLFTLSKNTYLDTDKHYFYNVTNYNHFLLPDLYAEGL